MGVPDCGFTFDTAPGALLYESAATELAAQSFSRWNTESQRLFMAGIAPRSPRATIRDSSPAK